MQHRFMCYGVVMRTKNKSNLVLFEVFLLIDFCKTLLTLLMVQR